MQTILCWINKNLEGQLKNDFLSFCERHKINAREDRTDEGGFLAIYDAFILERSGTEIIVQERN